MLVIGVIGRNYAGKDALVDILHERCSLPTLSVGDVVRESEGTCVERKKV